MLDALEAVGEIKDQLDLGHSWFADRLEAKAQLAKTSTASDKKWKGIYHDNGLCIDIIVPFCAEHALVLVSQIHPLTITDGLHSTEASLTAACLDDLRARSPAGEIAVGATWAVKKYTIRYTSYGPPRDKLRITLDAVDCVSVNACQGKLTPNAEALRRSNDIASTLQLIHSARVQDDHRCLRSQPGEEEDTADGSTMAGADERMDEDASMNSQTPFGTQWQHPIRSRPSDDHVSFVGINRLEPVLAGNTQRAELKPRSASTTDAQRKQAHLLSLLNKVNVQRPASPQAPARSPAHATPEPTRSGEHITTPSPRPTETPSKRASRETIGEPIAQASQTPQDKGKKRMLEVEAESPSVHSAKKTSFSEDQPKRHHASEDKFAAECSWMKGLTFNRATATVPDDQVYLLNKPESWAKQSRFPSVNIPMALFTVFSRTVDEKAALEGATSSGSFHETQSSASYPANSAPPPTELQDGESEDKASSSPISWKASPSPRPPQRPTLPLQQLPPDSSLEISGDDAEAAQPQWPAVRRDQPPPSTLPASSHESDEELPPSSPPAQLAAVDSDDDMELETSIPLALGEDLSQPSSASTQNHVPYAEIRSRSVVQVKETPYIKSKDGQQPVVTVCPPTQEPTSHSSSASIVRGTYNPSSSAVEETRLDGFRKGNDAYPSVDTSADLQAEIQDAQVVPDDGVQDMSMFDMFVHDDPTLEPVLQDASERQARKQQPDIPQVAQAQPEPTPMSAQLPPKDSSSGEQPPLIDTRTAMPAPKQPERQPSRQPSDTPSLPKRKHAVSPTLDRRRGSRAKRPKYAFGNKDPQTLIRERHESLQIERQKSTASAESRQGSVSNASVQQNPDEKLEELDTKETVKAQIEEANAPTADDMSPRHRSLYALPSPVQHPVAAPPAADATIESISLDQPQEKQQEAFTEQNTGNSASADPANVHEKEAPSLPEVVPEPQMKPQPQAEPVSAPAPVSTSTPAPVPRPSPAPSQPSAEISASTKHALLVTHNDTQASLSIFDKFKAAYPEYKASSKHFANQCKLIDELDREDKMVPKWMWDDFIVRNRIDYAQYAADCIDSGEEPMKYIRFYKDTIRDAIFKKRIIETRAVLEEALRELGVDAPATKASAPQPRVQQAAKQAVEPHSQPIVQELLYARQARRKPAQQSPRELVQSSPRHPTPQQTHSPIPPHHRPANTPPKKRSSRKSLPFAVPSSVVSSRVNGTAHVRHSLPASSSRAAPTTTSAQTASTRPASSTQQKPRSSFGDSLRFYKSQPSASPLETGTGDEYRDFIKAHEALTATTGSKRVAKATPWPRSIEGRPSMRDLPKKKIDVLEWTDVL
ncbi:hypothetical protein E8E12_001844 [Didymella heteroderae]|uniref:Telomere replication protein EST3 n=1 Tax=Didymella heteroderae TaxID=1769908 RepID=A0A9P5C548_9PLEO|nr:hypothetical protein E8E12_001844 [Didymella heteroderae]